MSINMKVIIPLAGKGARLRPHTHTKAKPMVHVAGKPILGHILDRLRMQLPDVKDVIFITGHLGHQIKEYVNTDYPFLVAKYFEQKELKGQAHAIGLTKESIDDDVLIWFVDTISDVNLSILKNLKSDGALFVKKVKDARRFGIVIPGEDGYITEIEEKPENPRSNLVNIGLYYIKNYKLLFECIDELISAGRQTKGEYYLVDALQMMINKGQKFSIEEVGMWEDCGTPETLLATNRHFLENGVGIAKTKKFAGSKIINPVFIEEDVKIVDSEIGPFVSISRGTIITSSIIRNSIVGKHTSLSNCDLDNSVIGEETKVQGVSGNLNIGDHSVILQIHTPE